MPAGFRRHLVGITLEMFATVISLRRPRLTAVSLISMVSRQNVRRSAITHRPRNYETVSSHPMSTE